jgi:hypothetical protein
VPVPTEVRAALDFHAVHCQGSHVWVAGRPGSMLLHSADQGKTWELRATGQPLPLNGIYFSDEKHGWVVGELGSIWATQDGGQSWRLQRRGGQRVAVLFVHARAGGFPLDTVAVLGGEEGYLAAGLRVNAEEATSAAATRAADEDKLAAALRGAGGAAAEMLWQFPVPGHRANSERRELVEAWNRLHADRAPEELLRQLVLAVRIWRPDVIITDHPDAAVTGCSMEALTAEAVHEAFVRAADANAFPEQLKTLGLEVWRAGKLYGRWENRTGAQVALDLNNPSARLGATPKDFAAAAAGLLGNDGPSLPAVRFYRLLDSRLEGAAAHRELMQGVILAGGGVARRLLRPLTEADADVLKTIRTRRNLEALAEAPAAKLAEPTRILAGIAPALKVLPDDQGAAAAFAVADRFARAGEWQLAREVFLLMVDHYPAHPLSAGAYRWLIRHNCSGEARRRLELGQFKLVTDFSFRPSQAPPVTPATGIDHPAGRTLRGGVEQVKAERLAYLGDRTEVRQWYQGSLDFGARLAAFGPLFATDPSIQFCMQSARRSLGEFEAARKWYTQFRKGHPEGPWGDAAAAELWLVNRKGPPPKPVAVCRWTQTRPLLDGKFDDQCWEDYKPLVLRNAVGDTVKEYGTEAWLAHDGEFLYLAVRCRHPENGYVPPVKGRGRDADLRPFDRIDLLLDLDRDYSTYFRLQVDQRGAVSEDCWGDRHWNPRWFVAVHSEKTCWQVEAAIPLIELTGDALSASRTWACNVVRVLPGRGVQAWSVPADVEPRPEGMGLLMFPQGAEAKKLVGEGTARTD